MRNSSDSDARSPRSPRTKRLRTRDRENLRQLLRRLRIDRWDLLIVGDGSGSGYAQRRGIGWASVSIERVTKVREVWYGAANRGTVNMAELQAYLQPLHWFADQPRPPGRALAVHIVTDSKYCADQGTARHLLMTKNVGLWAQVNAYARLGISITWHHKDRDDVMLNRYADRLSKLARRTLERYNLQETVEQDAGRTVDDYNPEDD